MEEVGLITYEKLYELVRNEKTSGELQKIDPDTYRQIANYLRTKILNYKSNNHAQSELEKIKDQIKSARSLIKTFYEYRERKITALAINQSRTKDKVDTRNLLIREKLIFNELTDVLSKHRNDILLSLVNAKEPGSAATDNEAVSQEKKDVPTAEPKNTAQQSSEYVTPTVSSGEQNKVKSDPYKEMETIRFTKPVPKFLGAEMETYGPFVEGDIARLPKIITKILINKEHAVVIDKS